MLAMMEQQQLLLQRAASPTVISDTAESRLILKPRSRPGSRSDNVVVVPETLSQIQETRVRTLLSPEVSDKMKSLEEENLKLREGQLWNRPHRVNPIVAQDQRSVPGLRPSVPTDLKKIETPEAELLRLREENTMLRQSSDTSISNSRTQPESSNVPGNSGDEFLRPCLKSCPSSPDSGQSRVVCVGSPRVSQDLSDSLERSSFRDTPSRNEGSSFEEMSTYTRGNYLGDSFEFSRRRSDSRDSNRDRNSEENGGRYSNTERKILSDEQKNDARRRPLDENSEYSRERSKFQSTNREGDRERDRDRSRSTGRKVVFDERKNSHRSNSDSNLDYFQERSGSWEAKKGRDREEDKNQSSHTSRETLYDESKDDSRKSYEIRNRGASKEKGKERSSSRSGSVENNSGSDDLFEERPSKRLNVTPSRSGRGSNEILSDEEEESKRRGSDDKSRRRSNYSNSRPYGMEREKRRRYDLKLDKFDGTGTLEVFLYQFDNCSQHNEWDEFEKLSQLKGAFGKRSGCSGNDGRSWRGLDL